jgi:xenotropic and polytropic retrovirus receptor 1
MFSGLYPIEFRDFFLGDQYNSLAYSFANIPFFFCLYAKNWTPDGIEMCGSSHSHVLGFFAALPATWRLLQCLRRFVDTRHAFPHLANAGKYSAAMLMYTMLSLWRIYNHTLYKAWFIVFATINTVYACKLFIVLC